MFSTKGSETTQQPETKDSGDYTYLGSAVDFIMGGIQGAQDYYNAFSRWRELRANPRKVIEQRVGGRLGAADGDKRDRYGNAGRINVSMISGEFNKIDQEKDKEKEKEGESSNKNGLDMSWNLMSLSSIEQPSHRFSDFYQQISLVKDPLKVVTRDDLSFIDQLCDRLDRATDDLNPRNRRVFYSLDEVKILAEGERQRKTGEFGRKQLRAITQETQIVYRHLVHVGVIQELNNEEKNIFAKIREKRPEETLEADRLEAIWKRRSVHANLSASSLEELMNHVDCLEEYINAIRYSYCIDETFALNDDYMARISMYFGGARPTERASIRDVLLGFYKQLQEERNKIMFAMLERIALAKQSLIEVDKKDTDLTLTYQADVVRTTLDELGQCGLTAKYIEDYKKRAPEAHTITLDQVKKFNAYIKTNGSEEQKEYLAALQEEACQENKVNSEETIEKEGEKDKKEDNKKDVVLPERSIMEVLTGWVSSLMPGNAKATEIANYIFDEKECGKECEQIIREFFEMGYDKDKKEKELLKVLFDDFDYMLIMQENEYVTNQANIHFSNENDIRFFIEYAKGILRERRKFNANKIVAEADDELIAKELTHSLLLEGQEIENEESCDAGGSIVLDIVKACELARSETIKTRLQIEAGHYYPRNMNLQNKFILLANHLLAKQESLNLDEVVKKMSDYSSHIKEKANEIRSASKPKKQKYDFINRVYDKIIKNDNINIEDVINKADAEIEMELTITKKIKDYAQHLSQRLIEDKSRESEVVRAFEKQFVAIACGKVDQAYDQIFGANNQDEMIDSILLESELEMVCPYQHYLLNTQLNGDVLFRRLMKMSTTNHSNNKDNPIIDRKELIDEIVAKAKALIMKEWKDGRNAGEKGEKEEDRKIDLPAAIQFAKQFIMLKHNLIEELKLERDRVNASRSWFTRKTDKKVAEFNRCIDDIEIIDNYKQLYAYEKKLLTNKELNRKRGIFSIPACGKKFRFFSSDTRKHLAKHRQINHQLDVMKVKR